jgi:DNA-binding MarR family transcriptional regulator
MKQLKQQALIEEVTATLLRVINRIHLGRRLPREYGGGRKMTLIEAEMCDLISRREGINGTQISQELGVTRSATSQYMAKLEEKGCISYAADPKNARIKQIFLTNEGKRYADLASRYSKLMQLQLYRCSKEELQHYYNFVKKLENFHKKVLNEMTENENR